MELNKVYNSDWLENKLPDKCAKLIILDPPYFNIKGHFDFIWDTFDDYLKDVRKWAIESKRLLADNGTVFLYGDRKNIAYSQIIFDEFFNLESNVTIKIINKQTNRIKPEDARSFLNSTERVLMYSNEIEMTGTQFIEMEYIAPRNPYALALKEARLKAGISIKDVAEHGKFYGNVNHGGAVTNWEKGYNVPLPDQWAKMAEILPLQTDYASIREQYDDLRLKYDGLRLQYEEKRRYFLPPEKYKTDVWEFSMESHITKKYDHETVKPEKLSRMLIISTTRPNDFVLIPFAGSGTECAMALKEGRNFVGFDIENKYVSMANERCQSILNKPELFTHTQTTLL